MTLGQNVPKLDALHLMDGIKGLRSLPKHSVDILLTDPPYGTTAVAAMNTHRRFICFENAPSIYTSPPSASSRRGWPWPGAGKENNHQKVPYHLRRSPVALLCKESTGRSGKSLSHHEH